MSRQAARPQAIVDLIRSAETMRIDRSAASEQPLAGTCERCGYITSQARTCLWLVADMDDVLLCAALLFHGCIPYFPCHYRGPF